MTTKVKAVKDKEISEMFNQMLGAGDEINLNIVYPKYLQMEEYSKKSVEIIEKFAGSAFFTRYGETYANHVQIMLKFCNNAKEEIEDMYKLKLPALVALSPDSADDKTKASIADAYKFAKTHPLTTTFINLCNKLVIYRRYIQDEATVNHKFILNMVDLEFNPFPFIPTLNIKEILVQMQSEVDDGKYTDKQERIQTENVVNQLSYFCMIVIHKLYKLTYNLYKVITSPDIDVDEFVNVIIMSIDKIKHQPQLSRCDLAFDKIKESASMLKENFSDYYKDFLESKNSSIIMENFILDVSKKNENSNPKLMQQFRRIVAHYRTLAKNNIQNPQIRSLFDKVNQQFSQAEKHAGNIVNIEKGGHEYVDPDDAEADRLAAEEANKIHVSEEELEMQRIQTINAGKSVDDVMKNMGLSDKKKGKNKKRN